EDKGQPVYREDQDRLLGRHQWRDRLWAAAADRIRQRARILANQELLDRRQPADVQATERLEQNAFDREHVCETQADCQRRLPALAASTWPPRTWSRLGPCV